MPDNSDREGKHNSQSAENIEIPPIPKQTAGAVAGAAVGSIAGPIGAVVGGVAGALAGKTAEKRSGSGAATRKSVATMAKSPKARPKQIHAQRLSKKSVSTSRKAGARYRGKAKRTVLRRSQTTKSRKAAGGRRQSTSSRSVGKRGGRKKRR